MFHEKQYIIISDNFPPCRGGGIAEWAYGIAYNLAVPGHKVTVLSRWKPASDAEMYQGNAFGVKAMLCRDWNRYRYWYALYYLFHELRRNPDATVIATTWELAEPMILLCNIFPKSSFIVIAHGLEVTRLFRNRQIIRFRRTIQNARLTVAVSRFTQNGILGKIPGITTPVIFLPNGVDTDRFHPVDTAMSLRKRLGIKPETRIILTLARVIERKGHDTVLKALPAVLSEFPNTLYIIAGPWHAPYYEKLQDIIREKNLERHVQFTSFVDDCDLNAYYSMSDIYVMVSRTIEQTGDSEGFGITFLEANACLCPVIGSYAGGIPDAVENGVNGLLVDPDDYKALQEKILMLFRNEKLRANLAKQGFERVCERFTWKKITGGLLREIEQLTT